MTCIFCDILKGNVPASFVYDDDSVVGIMSLEQPSPYKVLVLPREHVETIYDLSEQQASDIFTATVRIAKAIRDLGSCDGMNIVQSNGQAAQQTVFHFHLHIVPRSKNDTITLQWNNEPADRETLETMAENVRQSLEGAPNKRLQSDAALPRT